MHSFPLQRCARFRANFQRWPYQSSASNRLGQKTRTNSDDFSYFTDHLVGTGQDRGRNRQAERLGGVKVHRQIEFAGRFDRYSTWLHALEDPVNETRGAAEQVAVIGGERHQSALGWKDAK